MVKIKFSFFQVQINSIYSDTPAIFAKRRLAKPQKDSIL